MPLLQAVANVRCSGHCLKQWHTGGSRHPCFFPFLFFEVRFGFGGSSINSSRSPGVMPSAPQILAIVDRFALCFRRLPMFSSVPLARPVRAARISYVIGSPVRRLYARTASRSLINTRKLIVLAR